MKKLYTSIIVFISVLGLSLLSNSCTNMPEVIDELTLANVLTPTSTSATISNADGRTTTFTWSSSSTATNYVLEIYRWDPDSAPSTVTVDSDGSVSGSLYLSQIVQQGSGTTTSWEQYLDNDYTYYARVKGQNLDEYGYQVQGDSNWAEFRYPLEPYLVMDPLPSFEVTDRTANTITLTWTAEEGDTDIIDQIRVSPDPDSSTSSYKKYDVTSGALTYTVDGLKASTMYTIAGNYGTATRNTVVAWTKSGVEGTTVTTSDELAAAITGGQSPIIVAYSDDPYVIDDDFSIGDTGNDELCVYGDGAGDGSMPTIYGKFTLASGTSVKTIHLEGLAMVGDASNNVCVFSIDTGDYTEVSMLNCTVDSYLRGIINAGSKDVNIEKFDLNSIYATNITGDGGGFIDFRGSTAATLGTFSITNSTFDGGIREFVRIDDKYTVSDFTFDHNTVNAITTADNSYGVFYVRAAISNTCAVTNNLWLNLADSYVHGVSGRYVMGATVFAPTSSTGNYWYNIGDTSEDSTDNIFGSAWSMSSAISGGAILDADPCYDSLRGNFYVTDATVINAGAGDPRWYGDYVPEPEEELEVVEYGTTWDMTDTKTFYDEADQTVVHGNLKFIVEDNPIQISDAGTYFTSKSTLMSYSGVPTDCALAFLVDGPGSVVVSTTGSWNSQIEVSYAPYDASTGLISSTFTTVAGSASAGADNEYISAVEVPEYGCLNYPEDGVVYVVYVYVSSPMYLTSLAWVKDINPSADLRLGTPQNVTVSPTSIVVKDTDPITVSWDDVFCAGSYTLYENGAVLVDNYTETSYTFDASAYEIGDYNYIVMANPFSGSIRTDSARSDAAKFTVESNWTTVPTDAVTIWDTETWGALAAVYGTSDAWKPTGTPEVYDDGLLAFYNNGGSGYKFGTGNLDADHTGVYRVQLAGSGNATKCNLQFRATTAGTLEFAVISTGDSERYANVYIGDTALTDADDNTIDYVANATSANDGYPTINTVELSDITEDTTISIASKSSGINLFYLKWTPTGVTE